MRTNISIIGLMNSYNNKVANVLADKLDVYYLNGLEYIVYELTYPIDTFISDFGKELYEKKESKAIQALKDYQNTIIVVPLGVIEKRALLEHLKTHSWIVLLTANPNSIRQREKGAEYDNQKKFIGFADIVIDSSGLSPLKCAKAIMDNFVKIMEEKYEV